MDAGSIELILTALAAAGGAGVATGIQDSAGKAVNSTYDAIAARVSKLLLRRTPMSDPPTESEQLGPEDLLAKFRLDPDSWRPVLAKMLAAAPEPDQELRALISNEGELGQQNFVSDSGGVLISHRSYQPIQVNYFEPRDRGDSDSTAS